MEVVEQTNCSGIKRKKPLPTASGDADQPPEQLEVTSNTKSDDVGGGTGTEAQQNQFEDEELMQKSDHEITETVARIKRNLQAMAHKLPDRGEKLKANLARHELEFERRKKVRLDKANGVSEETIQLSDHSDEGASHGKLRSSSKSINLVCKKTEEDKDPRTVYAFEKDLVCLNPCHGKKLKSVSQRPGKPSKGRSSTRSLEKSSVDNKKQIVSTDENKADDSTTSVTEPSSPQDRPSRNLRPRSARDYRLVDEESVVEKFMKNLDPCMHGAIIYYPSRNDPNSIEVSYAYMECLAPEAYISSMIIDFYIRYLQQTSSPSENATCHYHFFNTYFYNKLEKLSYNEDSFRKFRKWWKGVNIFEKAYILLPIHESSHWSLVIICLPNQEDEQGPFLLHLDSLGLHDSNSLFDNIRRFLKEEWGYLRKLESPLHPPIQNAIWENLDSTVEQKRVTVPQQKNDYDCGLFVLFYMERFLKEAPMRFRKEDLAMFTKQWFRPWEASELRGKIYDLLVQEFKKAKGKSSS